jgi:hypothetical protein
MDNQLKREVKNAMVSFANSGLADVLDAIMDFDTIEVYNVDNLSFNIRFTFPTSNAPRYITVKVSEGW